MPKRNYDLSLLKKNKMSLLDLKSSKLKYNLGKAYEENDCYLLFSRRGNHNFSICTITRTDDIDTLPLSTEHFTTR